MKGEGQSLPPAKSLRLPGSCRIRTGGWRSGLGLRADCCDDRVSPEVPPGGGEDLFTSEGLDPFSVFEVVEGSKTEKGVEGTDLRHGVVALVFECVTGQNAGLGMGQRILRDTFLGEDFYLASSSRRATSAWSGAVPT